MNKSESRENLHFESPTVEIQTRTPATDKTILEHSRTTKYKAYTLIKATGQWNPFQTLNYTDCEPNALISKRDLDILMCFIESP